MVVVVTMTITMLTTMMTTTTTTMTMMMTFTQVHRRDRVHPFGGKVAVLL
jgi:hypothetical protein